MIRMLIVIVMMLLMVAALWYTMRAGAVSKHRHWQPGSKPMRKPPRGQRWAYNTEREEWYLEDV